MLGVLAGFFSSTELIPDFAHVAVLGAAALPYRLGLDLRLGHAKEVYPTLNHIAKAIHGVGPISARQGREVSAVEEVRAAPEIKAEAIR